MPSSKVTLAIATAVLLAVCSVAYALPNPSNGIGGHPFPYPFIKTATVPSPSLDLHLYLQLQQRNLPQLESIARDVNNPRSPKYRHYLSQHDISQLVSPSDADITCAEKWLRDSGITRMYRHPHGHVVKFIATVAQAEKMFSVKMAVYQHTTKYHTVVRTVDKPSITTGPFSEVVKQCTAVTGVFGLTQFPAFTRHGSGGVRDAVKAQVSAQVPKPFVQVQERRRTPIQSGVHVRSSSTDASGASVDVTLLRGGEESVTITLTPMCGASQPATDNPPCAGQFPQCVFTFTNADNGNRLVLPPTSVTDCTVASTTSCTVKVAGVSNYVNYNVSAACGTGPTTYAPYLVVASPNVTPDKLNTLYNIPANQVVTRATQSVVEFEQQYYSPADLTQYLNQMGLPLANITVIGPNNASLPGGEANLDIQWILGVAPGAPTTFWSIQANSTAEIDDILKWAYAIGNTTDPPMVNSLSYGMSEDNVDKYLGTGYLAASDIEFQKLAAQGLTVIIACGDTGAGDLGGPPMGNSECQELHPDWPSQSEWVTAVGSTYVTPYDRDICYAHGSTPAPTNCAKQELGEVTVSLDAGMRWTTGGGFSNVVPRPKFQAAVVDAYVQWLATQKSAPPTTVFNSTNRAYPDVATVGHNLLTVVSGAWMPIDGTSASAPIFAGIITLLNEALLKAGSSKGLGCVNQLLYQIAASETDSFYDVTVGNNRCGSYGPAPQCCPWGFDATIGWDATSGLGSPNYGVLLQSILKVATP